MNGPSSPAPKACLCPLSDFAWLEHWEGPPRPQLLPQPPAGLPPRSPRFAASVQTDGCMPPRSGGYRCCGPQPLQLAGQGGHRGPDPSRRLSPGQAALRSQGHLGSTRKVAEKDRDEQQALTLPSEQGVRFLSRPSFIRHMVGPSHLSAPLCLQRTGLVGPRGTSWGLVGPHGASWGLVGPRGAQRPPNFSCINTAPQIPLPTGSSPLKVIFLWLLMLFYVLDYLLIYY